MLTAVVFADIPFGFLRPVAVVKVTAGPVIISVVNGGICCC